jgi:hypothetical protein
MMWSTAVSKKVFLWILFCLNIPCFGRLVDVKKFALKAGKSHVATRTNNHQNKSACHFPFHGYQFLSKRQVNLTDHEHFQGRQECTVEFFNLPRGKFFLEIIRKAEEEENGGNTKDTAVVTVRHE